jgi:hypothetical protein
LSQRGDLDLDWMQLQDREPGAQIGLDLGAIERAAGLDALGRRADQIAALALRDVGELVHEQLVAVHRPGRILPASEEDVGAERERARVVRRGDQARRVIAMNTCRGCSVAPDMRSESRHDVGGQAHSGGAAAQHALDLTIRCLCDQPQDRDRSPGKRLARELAQRRCRGRRIRGGQRVRRSLSACGRGDEAVAQHFRCRRAIAGRGRVESRHECAELALDIRENQARERRRRRGPRPAHESPCPAQSTHDSPARAQRSDHRSCNTHVRRPGTDACGELTGRAAAAARSQRRYSCSARCISASCRARKYSSWASATGTSSFAAASDQSNAALLSPRNHRSRLILSVKEARTCGQTRQQFTATAYPGGK